MRKIVPVGIKDSAFRTAVMALAGGTAVAQLIPLLISPILTRLYTPYDFGQLALFMALISSVGMAVSGRYDMALLMPRRNVYARQLFGLAFWVSTAVCTVYLLLTFAPEIRFFSGAENLGVWIYAVPAALMITASRTTFSYWANRNGHFFAILKAQWTQTLLNATLSLTLGFVGVGFSGLLIGNVGGVLGAVLIYFWIYRGQFGRSTLKWTRSKSALARKFRDYPIYSASSAILDGITLALPVFFLTHYFPVSSVGHYALVARVASAPLSFISLAVAQVHMKKVVQLQHEGGDLPAYLRRLIVHLSLIAALPTLIFTTTGPWLFHHIFGEEWREAGSYLQILAPSIAVRFVGSTLSGTMETTNNSHIGAIWKVIALIVTALVLLVLSPYGDMRLLLIGIALGDTALYVLYAYLAIYAGARPRTGKL